MEAIVLKGYKGAGWNQLMIALSIYIFEGLRPLKDDIDGPEVLEDLVNEWLHTEGVKFRRCRVQAVVMQIRPFKDYPTLRIYHEDLQHVLHPHLFIGFREKPDAS